MSIEKLKTISGGKGNQNLHSTTKEEAKKLKDKAQDGFEEHTFPHVLCHNKECHWID